MSCLTIRYSSDAGSVHDWCLVLCDPGQASKEHIMDIIKEEYSEHMVMVKELVEGDCMERLTTLVKQTNDKQRQENYEKDIKDTKHEIETVFVKTEVIINEEQREVTYLTENSGKAVLGHVLSICFCCQGGEDKQM